MAFTQADADSLRAAIARGARRVRINGEEVEYNTFPDMRAALRMIEDELSGAAGGPGPGAFVVTYPKTGRGL